jgi:hypothetical protein
LATVTGVVIPNSVGISDLKRGQIYGSDCGLSVCRLTTATLIAKDLERVQKCCHDNRSPAETWTKYLQSKN